MRPAGMLEWLAVCTSARLAPVDVPDAISTGGTMFVDWGRAFPADAWPVVAVDVPYKVREGCVEVDPATLEGLVSGPAVGLPDAMHALVVATDNFSRGLLGLTTPLALAGGCRLHACFETSLGFASLSTTLRPKFAALVDPLKLGAQANPLACLFVDPVDGAVRFYAQGLWNDRGVWYIVDGELLGHLETWFRAQTTARLRERLRAFLRATTSRGRGPPYSAPLSVRQAVARAVLAPSSLSNPFSLAPCDPFSLDDSNDLPFLADPDLFAHNVPVREAAMARAMRCP